MADNTCPNCGGPLQTIQTLDSDDSIIAEAQVCKKKMFNKKKKGCGFRRKIK